MTVEDPRDQYSEVVDERRRWTPDWYTWLWNVAREIVDLRTNISDLQPLAATFVERVIELTTFPSSTSVVLITAYGLANGNGRARYFEVNGGSNDITTVGPNGRDQAGAFGATDAIAFYAIVKPDGSSATLSSTSQYLPTLPAGYEFSCYLFSLVLVGGALPSVIAKNKTVHFTPLPTPLVTVGASAANATPTLSVSNSAQVPPRASSIIYLVRFNGGTAAAAATLSLGISSGVAVFTLSANPGDFNGCEVELVKDTSNLFYGVDLINAVYSITVRGWREP